ncbi:MAG: DUF3037 domain-containing protein [Comamonas sp.]|jgi:hypothetical protein|uniref:DUF3037 domain-containing protein n=1 Tax=Comamonas sp. TaxID=34028 RepID=UPI00282F1B75|nr:DUF3037 domain-containing protein [Comamonas sp.]MDR0216161.1 DUF3037 domain-containing protein [Comamonas sp.]
MTPLACRYAIIQFTPFVETGEFANVGVVLVCPKTGYIDYKIQRRRAKRITDFFHGIDRSHYFSAIDATIDELEYVKDLLSTHLEHQTADRVRHLFSSLVRPREAIIKFSAERALLSQDPASALSSLYEHYVEHSFATKEYIEDRMNEHLRTILNRLSLRSPFKAEKLGNEELHAQFQFVQTIDAKPIKLIKALNLSQKDALSIGDHGDGWIGRMRRLERASKLDMPEHKLFTVHLAPKEDVARFEIGMEVVRDLESLGIKVISDSTPTAVDEITQFAVN